MIPLAKPHRRLPFTVALALRSGCTSELFEGSLRPPRGWPSLVGISLLAFLVSELPGDSDELSGLGTRPLTWWHASQSLVFPGLYICPCSYTSQKLFSLWLIERVLSVCVWGLGDPPWQSCRVSGGACFTEGAAEAQSCLWDPGPPQGIPLCPCLKGSNSQHLSLFLLRVVWGPQVGCPHQ